MISGLIWLLVAFSPDGRMELVKAIPDERVCRQEALRKSVENRRLAFSCMQSTPLQGP